MKKNYIIVLLSISLSLILGGCAIKSSNQQDEQKEFTVATTCYPMYHFTKEVMGNYGKVIKIIPDNVEPHDYEPSAKQMAQINDADAIVYNNNDMEFWIKNLSINDNKKIEASKDVKLIKTDGAIDPHTWNSPKEAIIEMNTITNHLCQLKPEKSKYFKDNAKKYITKLSKVDKEYEKVLKNKQNKTLLTQHAAFSYVARDYKFHQLSIMGLSDEQEPSSYKLSQLKSIVKKDKIHYICVESNESNKIATSLASENNMKLLDLNPLEQVSPKQVNNSDFFIETLQNNLNTIDKALNNK